MRILKICSFVAGLSALIFGLVATYLSFKNGSNGEDFSILMAVVILVSFTQLLYTLKAAQLLNFRTVKIDDETLDSFSLNQINDEEQILSMNLFYRAVGIINSFVMACFALVVSFLLNTIIRLVSIYPSNDSVSNLLVMALIIAYLNAIPAIIFNIRTINLKVVGEG